MANAANRASGRLWTGARGHPWWTFGVVVVLAAAGGGAYWEFGRTGAARAADPLTRTVTASTGTIRESITTTGTIEPAEQDELNFGASGVVTAVHVAQGDAVRKGQVLATIDSAALKASLAQAQASLAAAQARVAADQDSSTTTATQLSADQAAVTAAQGQVSSAQTALTDADLTSPIDGVVASVSLSVGQQVSGAASSAGRSGSGSSGAGSSGAGSSGGGNGSGSGNGTGSDTSSAQVEVIGTSSWVADATVDATELGQVSKGLQAQITLDGASTPVFGTVSSVGVLPTSGSSTAAYPVTVNVTGNPAGLHAGASATVAIIYRQLNNVLTVPSLAVRTSNGKSVVTVVSNGKPSTRTVTTGASSGGEVQITSGLTAGEQVLVSIPTRARAGTGNSGTGTNRTGNGRFGGGGFGGGGGGGGVFVPGGGGGNFPGVQRSGS